MATKRKPKPQPEPILNSQPLKSAGVIVTHPERHITPGNASIVWLIVMMAIIGGVGAVCTTIWWQKEDLATQIEAPYMQDNGPYFSRFMRNMREKMTAVKEFDTESGDKDQISNLIGNRDIYSKIEDWESYEKIPNNSWQDVLTNCSEWSESPNYTDEMRRFDAMVATIASGDMYVLKLPGESLIYTPGVDEAFVRLYQSDAVRTCGFLGGYTPLHIYQDKIVWGNLSCGGVLVEPTDNQEAYALQQSCIRTTSVLADFFGDTL